jgi:hypothetical protein
MTLGGPRGRDGGRLLGPRQADIVSAGSGR